VYFDNYRIEPLQVFENKELTELLSPVSLAWLPLLDRFNNWLLSGEASIFDELYKNTFSNK
jgi:hypothetical protein